MTVLTAAPAIDHEREFEECEALGYESVAQAENASLRFWRENVYLRHNYAAVMPHIAAGLAVVTGVLVA